MADLGVKGAAAIGVLVGGAAAALVGVIGGGLAGYFLRPVIEPKIQAATRDAVEHMLEYALDEDPDTDGIQYSGDLRFIQTAPQSSDFDDMFINDSASVI